MSEGIYQACISRWKIRDEEKLSLFCIINPERGKQRTPYLRGLNDNYKKFASDNDGEICKENNLLLHRFLYNQFNRKGTEREYWISALISYGTMKVGVDGILYESARGKKIGFENTVCVALNKDAVDCKLEYSDHIFVRSDYYFANGDSLILRRIQPHSF